MSNDGCAVFLLTDANAHTIPARTFRGALNLAQGNQGSLRVQFYSNSSMSSGALIAAAGFPGGNGGGQGVMDNEIGLEEGTLTFVASFAPIAPGIAILYDVE